MVSSVTFLSHRLCHKATSQLYVLSSGNCLLIIDHDILAAAEQNKKVGVGRWVAENKIGNSVSERKNFTPMWSHVFLKKWELVTHTTKLNAGSPTDSLETESIKVL